jgi:hypothetical protein
MRLATTPESRTIESMRAMWKRMKYRCVIHRRYRSSRLR